MVRNVLGSLVALVGATAAVWSPFRPWYDGRHGSDVRIEDLFNGITDNAAALFGSILLPMAFAALLTLIGIALRSRLTVTLAGLVVFGFTILWMVRQGQAAGELTAGTRGLGIGVGSALGGGALMLLGALIMRGHNRRAYGRGDDRHYDRLHHQGPYDRGYDDGGYERGYDGGYDDRAYGHGGYDGRGYGDRGYGHRGYGERPYDNGRYGRRYVYDDPYDATTRYHEDDTPTTPLPVTEPPPAEEPPPTEELPRTPAPEPRQQQPPGPPPTMPSHRLPPTPPVEWGREHRRPQPQQPRAARKPQAVQKPQEAEETQKSEAQQPPEQEQ
ncbi:Syd protein [Streptomyces sp. NBRC 110611]|uniref:hypothetical protein n=1 Tax=Streptomyces sp. NBRC 110611 TaxID=1621259 RepID=UPI000835DF91|nr:Syd protein [Streptomyces sp. NBRC 110611]